MASRNSHSIRLELLQHYRRGRQHTFRWLYAAWLVLELLALFFIHRSGPSTVAREATGDFVNTFVEWFAVQQYGLLLLVTPAFAAGSISDEKARGTLQDWLTTDLTSAEIVAGKLLAQVVRLLDLALVGLPLLTLIGVVGGMAPPLILAVFLSPLLPLIAVVAAGLLASIVCRTTREAVLALYFCGGVGLAALWMLPGGERYFDPRYVLTPAWDDADGIAWAGRWLAVGLVWAGVALLCFGLAVWRLRPDYARQMIAHRSKSGDWSWRPRVGDRPLYWKERYVERLTALPGLRVVPRWLGLGIVFGLGCLLSGVILSKPKPEAARFHGLAFVVMLFAGVSAAVRCSGAVTGERERQTWDALLLTPLESKELLRGKLWGVMDASRPFLLAVGLPIVVLSATVSAMTAVVMILWFVGAWLLMYYLGACGVEASVRSSGSWQALLVALTRGNRQFLGMAFLSYVMGFLLSAVLFVVGQGILEILGKGLGVKLLDHVSSEDKLGFLLTVGPAITLAFFFIGAAEAKMQEAEQHLARQDRIPQQNPFLKKQEEE